MNFVLCLLAALPLLGAPAVEYRLSFPNAVHHEAEISATFSGISQPVLEVVMSRSSPGRYALHEFAKNVYRFTATDPTGSPLTITRPNPYGWNISGHHGTVTVHYTLFGDHADGTYAGIDETHAHLNLPAALVWAHGFENAPSTLTFDMPPGSHWRAATQLIPQPNGTWSAPNLEWLMDSPVELSNHFTAEWQMDGQRFLLAVHHQGSPEELKAYAKNCQAIVLEAAGVFGGFPKFDNGSYTFLVDYLPYVFGDGMEHRDSTSITAPITLKDSAAHALGTVSHEFFHAWNVRRIRPRSLEPFDFERANMSGELWFAEGFTNYYGPLILQRAGLSTLDDFVRHLSGAVNEVLNAPGRELFSVVDMSRQASFVDAARSIDETNFHNTFISYYTYGEALAFGLDLAIREHFPGKSLDDWLRLMWHRHRDINKPYDLRDLENALAETTDAAFAHQVFEHHIYGREPLDYQSLVAAAGLKLQKAHAGRSWVGDDDLTFSAASPILSQTARIGSPLYLAGLDKGDEILKCDGKMLKDAGDFSSCLAKHHPGETLQIEYRSRAGIKKTSVTVAEDPKLELVTFEKAGLPISSQIEAFRQAWLASKRWGSRSPHEDIAENVVIW
jgi:predicted metalloprotease with PDZ domain